jgi:hypothetical protein
VESENTEVHPACCWGKHKEAFDHANASALHGCHKHELLTVVHVLPPDRLPKPRGLIVEPGNALFEWCKLQFETIEL